jgi:DNA repair exonuclease SbcCD nuclease subunit
MRYIITGDNHLRADRPLCRLDEDWIALQKTQLDFIVYEANRLEADVVITGDLFDVPRMPPKLVTGFIEAISPLLGKCYFIAGNHSLPWHKLENIGDSSMGILKAITETNEKLVYLETTEYTENGRFEHTAKLEDGVYVIHTLTFPSVEEIPFGAEATSAYQLLDKYPDAVFIFTGDYHTKFVVEDDGRYVINPGCMNIQAADMIDYQPCVYFVDTGSQIDVTTKGDKSKHYRHDDLEITAIPIPDDTTMLTRNHLDQQKARDSRISSFVETISHEGQIGLSFEDNLQAAIIANNLSQDIRDILTEVEEESK